MEKSYRFLPYFFASFLALTVYCFYQSYFGHFPDFQHVIAPIGNVPITITALTLFIPRGTPHAFVHLGEGTGRKLSTYQPAAKIEEMFRQIGLLKERTPEKIQEAMSVNNNKVVGKPLTIE